jgi:uncharacterized protein DUF3617
MVGSARACNACSMGGQMKHAALLIACSLPLSACNKQPDIQATNASVAEVSQKMRAATANGSFVRPGLWQSTVTFEQLDMPGMPKEMADKVKATMMQKGAHVSESCLTEEEVKRPKEEFFTGKNNACRYDHFTMSGGKIDAVMHCGKDGAMQTMQMTGTYSPESYQMHMSTKVEGGGPAEGGMAMRMRVEAKRIGECTGKEG